MSDTETPEQSEVEPEVSKELPLRRGRLLPKSSEGNGKQVSLGGVKEKLSAACRRRNVLGATPSELKGTTRDFYKDLDGRIFKGLGQRINTFALGLGEIGEEEQ